MADIRQAILKKKIDNAIVELLIKTSSAMVYVDDTTTLETKLTEILTDINTCKTQLSTLIGDDPASSITGQIEAAVNEAVEALTNAEDPDSLAGKIAAINTTIEAMQNETTGILATAKAYTDEKVGLSGTAYTTAKEYTDAMKDEVKASLAGAFHFKGNVDYVDLLPTEGAVEGDVYQVKYRGTSTEAGTEPLDAEYAYNGTEFVEFGSNVDLSAYSTTEQTTAAINTAKTEAIEAAATDATTKANTAKTEAIAASAEALDTAIEGVNTTMATKARFLVSETEPEDLTESDVWAQIVTSAD